MLRDVTDGKTLLWCPPNLFLKAIAKKSRKHCDLKDVDVFSHSSGGQKSEIEVLAELCSLQRL